MSINEKMTTLADAVREKAELTGKLTIDEMTAAITDLTVNGVEVDERTLSVTPSKETQTFTSSDLGENAYYSTVTVNAVPDEYITTSDATAVSGDILVGKTAYVNGRIVVGNMTNCGDYAENITFNSKGVWSNRTSGFYKSITLTADIRELEVTPQDLFPQTFHEAGVYYSSVTVKPIPENYKDTSDATAEAYDIVSGKTAYVNGVKLKGTISKSEPYLVADSVIVPGGVISAQVIVNIPPAEIETSENKVIIHQGGWIHPRSFTVGTPIGVTTITPSAEDQTIPADSYIASDVTIKGDAALVSENIKDGVSIFGVSGTFTGGGGGVNRLYISSGGGPDNRLFAELPGAFNLGNMQVPARRGVYNDIHAVNGSLWFARNGEIGEFGKRSRRITASEGWTLARGGIAVGDGELYAINGSAYSNDFSFSLFPDSPKNVTQLGFSYDGRRWCLSGNTAYIMSPHAGECKPAALAGVSVSKLLNQGMGTGWNYTYSQAALSTSGRALLLWGEHLEDGEPQAAHYEYVGNDVSFVNYFYKEYEDDGMGGRTYRLALKSDGTLYAQNASSLENPWQPVSGAPKFRTENCLGFCACSAQEDWETGGMRYPDDNVALHIAQDGTLWKISCDNTGVSVAQLDDSTEWIYVPPELGRNSKSYAQCDGILYVIESDSSANMNITWRKCYIQPAGKLIATSHDDSFLWFTGDDDTVDVTGLGVL